MVNTQTAQQAHLGELNFTGISFPVTVTNIISSNAKIQVYQSTSLDGRLVYTLSMYQSRRVVQ